MQSLSETCASKLDNFSNLDADWVQFCKDHRSLIIRTADIVTIPVDMQARYRYSLDLWLEDYGYNSNLMWMILWLNQIPNMINFVKIEKMIIPNEDTLMKLYNQYSSNKISADV